MNAAPVSATTAFAPVGAAVTAPADELSVVIVSWNACAHLRRCLASLEATAGALLREVVVVDNASVDGSPDMVEQEFPHVRLLRSPVNLGFAAGVNLGMRHTSAPAVAFVNSDVIVQPGCLQGLRAALAAAPAVGLAGPRILGPGGQVQGSCRRFPTVWNYVCRTLALDRPLGRWPLFSGHEMRHWAHDTPLEAEVLSGCFWLARRAAVDDVGVLDERFFFYMEDVDWCRRFRERGWKRLFVPEAVAVHHGGGSTANEPLRYSVQYHRAGLAYWHKYGGLAGALGYRALALLHHGLRGALRLAGTALPVGRTRAARDKLAEDAACLRWLLGRDRSAPGVRAAAAAAPRGTGHLAGRP